MSFCEIQKLFCKNISRLKRAAFLLSGSHEEEIIQKTPDWLPRRSGHQQKQTG